MLVSRQFLPFFAFSLLLASALVFIPASAASSLSITVDADHNEYSFASVNGTASFVVTITNDGDDDFTNVAIDSSFDDETWLKDNVTFTYSGNNASSHSARTESHGSAVWFVVFWHFILSPDIANRC